MKDEDYSCIEDEDIRNMLPKLKDMPERIAKQKEEYFARKVFVRKVFAQAVEEAIGFKPKE